jgi:hypothetical protein
MWDPNVGYSIWNRSVNAIAVMGSDVYVGGNFWLSGSNNVFNNVYNGGIPDSGNTNFQYITNITRFNPSTCTFYHLGSNDLNGPVFALASIGNRLFAGGTFTNAGGNPNANYIAEWDGTTWTNVGTGVGGLNSVGNPGAVYALAACGSNLYVGGDFTTAGGNTNANGIAKWDGKQWTTLQGGLIGDNCSSYDESIRSYPIPGMRVLTISVRGNTLFVGGEFNRARQGTGQVLAGCIAKAVWSEQSQTWTWTDLDEGVGDNNNNNYNLVTSTAIMEGQNPGSYDLFVGGHFYNVGTAQIPCNDMARWSVGRPYPAGPPSVIITNPVNIAVFTNDPANPINISITTIAWSYTNIYMEYFYTNGQQMPLLCLPGNVLNSGRSNNSDGSITYSAVWQNPPCGVYLLTVVALDKYKVASKPSQPVLIDIKNPTNSITAVDDVYTIRANSPAVTFYVLTNDIPANGLKISQITKLHNYLGSATVSFGGAYIRYTPFPNVYGIDTIYYTVTNANGALDTASVTINILPLPQVNIVSPWDGQRFTNPATSLVVTGWVASVNTDTNLNSTVSSQCGLESETNPIIRDGLFDLQGRAADSIATNPVAYQVLLFQPDPDAGMTDGDPAIEYLGDIPLANLTPGPLNGQGYHNGRDVNGALGRLDLTGIPDGVYVIMLKVRGGADETNALVQVQINSQLKIGQFSFSEQDLVLPVNGIPITITRTYNSQNPLSGDFGSGWSFALNSMDVQLDEQRQNVQIGGNSLASFDQDGFVMPTDMSSLLPHTVSIRAGGNRDVTLSCGLPPMPSSR